LGTSASWVYWVKPDPSMIPYTFEGDIVSNFSHVSVTGFQIALGQVAIGDGDGFDYQGTINPPLDVWTHVVVTYTSGSLKTYHNGVLVNTRTEFTREVVSPLTEGITVGQAENHHSISSHWYNGYMSNLAIFDTPLTAGQAVELYNSGELMDYRTSSASANIVSYWPLGLLTDTASSIADLGPADTTLASTLVSNPFVGDIP
jgi:hypothetical protein